MLQSKELKSKLAEIIKEFKSVKPFSQEIKQLIDDKFRLEFNFNSNHLEGNTLTYTETELLLRFDRTEGNHDFREYEEMQAHDVAYLMIETESIDQERPLTENFIRTINQTLLVKPYWKDAVTPQGDSTRKQIIPGQYKATPNSVILNNGTIFHYTAPADVQKEMGELVLWLNENINKEDPLVLAATLHYKFVRIHPFDDGNGRTARLLMNYILLRFELPVVIIKTDDKKEYLSALNKADTGDIQYFINYIGNQLLWSLDIQLKASRGEAIEEEDDIDKELSILRKKLAILPDEFEKSKSRETIVSLTIDSLLPLFEDIKHLVNNLSDLFVKTSCGVYALTPNVDEPLSATRIDGIKSEEILRKTLDSKVGYFDLDLELIALKKATYPTDFKHTIQITLEDYHYNLVHEFNSPLIRLPYGRSLTTKDRKMIINVLTREVIKEIKIATNIE